MFMLPQPFTDTLWNDFQRIGAMSDSVCGACVKQGVHAAASEVRT